MYKNVLNDLDLPSEFTQQSELNRLTEVRLYGGAFVRSASLDLQLISLHRTRGNLCTSQTYKSKLFKVVFCALISQFHAFLHFLLILNYKLLTRWMIVLAN